MQTINRKEVKRTATIYDNRSVSSGDAVKFKTSGRLNDINAIRGLKSTYGVGDSDIVQIEKINENGKLQLKTKDGRTFECPPHFLIAA